MPSEIRELEELEPMILKRENLRENLQKLYWKSRQSFIGYAYKKKEITKFLKGKLEELTKLEIPGKDTESNPIFLVARSFDINRPGTEIKNIHGGVLGGILKK